MARKPIIASIPNFASITEFVECAATSEATGFEAENLQDLRPSLPWRSTSPAPHKTIVRTFVRSSMLSFFRPEADIFGAAPTNLQRESGLYRVLGFSSASLRAPTELLPTGTGTTHNPTSGTYTDVDEGWGGAADANVIVLAAGQNCHLEFDVPAANPQTGARKQSFVIELEATNDPGTGATLSQCWLYQDNVLIASLGYKFLPGAITDRGPITLVWTWDAASLNTATGAKVQARFRLGMDAEIHRAAWICEETTTYATDQVFDSGWKVAWESLGGSRFSPVRPEEETFPPYALFVESTGVTHDDVLDFHVLFCDDQVPAVDVDGSGYITTAHVPRVPDGYVEAGCTFWTLGTELAKGAKYGRALRIPDGSPTTLTAGGQLLAAGRPKRRQVYLDAAALTEDEYEGLADRVDLAKGTIRPLLFIPEPDNVSGSQLLTVYGRAQEATDFLRLETSTPFYGKAYVFEEYR